MLDPGLEMVARKLREPGPIDGITSTAISPCQSPMAVNASHVYDLVAPFGFLDEIVHRLGSLPLRTPPNKEGDD